MDSTVAISSRTASATANKTNGAKGHYKSGPPGSNLFVFHLPVTWTTNDLLQHFKLFGNIISGQVEFDGNGVSRGYGFVSYAKSEDASKAAVEMNGFRTMNKRLKVVLKNNDGVKKKSKSKRPTPTTTIATQQAVYPATAHPMMPMEFGYPMEYMQQPMGFPSKMHYVQNLGSASTSASMVHHPHTPVTTGLTTPPQHNLDYYPQQQFAFQPTFESMCYPTYPVAAQFASMQPMQAMQLAQQSPVSPLAFVPAQRTGSPAGSSSSQQGGSMQQAPYLQVPASVNVAW